MIKKKILMIFCGGTIAMKPNKITGALKPARNSKELLEFVPEIKDSVDLDVIELFNVDSTEINSSHWEKIISTIYKNYEKYEGFLITHGTDTLVDTGTAISFAFGKNLTKPIVLTGSQSNIGAIGTDAKFNLENAFRVVISNVPEVMLSFGHFVLRASRSQKKHESDYNAFCSPNYEPLAKIRSEIEWSSKKQTLLPNTKYKLVVHNKFETDILTVKVNSGLTEKIISKIIDENLVKGIIFESLGAGNIPSKFFKNIEKATKKNIPCLIASPFIGGTTHSTTYELGCRALSAGAIETYDMTISSIYIKLMWSLSQINDEINKGIVDKNELVPMIRKMFKINYIGEVTLKLD